METPSRGRQAVKWGRHSSMCHSCESRNLYLFGLTGFPLVWDDKETYYLQVVGQHHRRPDVFVFILASQGIVQHYLVLYLAHDQVLLRTLGLDVLGGDETQGV